MNRRDANAWRKLQAAFAASGAATGDGLPALALSVRQPWAWAIMHGGKDVENRLDPSAEVLAPEAAAASPSMPLGA